MPYAKRRTSRIRPRRAATRRRAPVRTRARAPRKKQGHFGVTSLRPPKPTVQRGYLPFGNAYFCRLPYEDSLVLTNNTFQTAVKHNFNLGSLFDPDVSGGGHQPRQYDQLAPMYERYIVFGCKIDLTFFDPSADGIFVGIRIYITGSGTSTTGLSYSELSEMRDTWIKPINNSGSQRVTKSIYVPNNVPFGISKRDYSSDQDNYAALTTASPTRFVNFDVFVIDSNGSATTCKFTIKLVYYARLYNYKPASQS